MKYPIEYNKTASERRIYSHLPLELQDVSRITLDHRRSIEIVYDNLKHVYGDSIDPNTALMRYYKNPYSCKTVKQLDDIPLLTTSEVIAMVEEENELTNSIAGLNMFSNNINGTMAKAELLGLKPTESSKCLNDWLLGLQSETAATIEERIIRNKTVFEMATNSLCKQYEDGVLESFPVIGTTMTQPRRKFFYRGENAYYGSSKPSIFRGLHSQNDRELYLRHLRMDECGCFLDEFQAVRDWKYSDVNHLAIMQHYGMRTYMMDITSDIRVALFFACCEWENGKWVPLSQSKTANKAARKDIAKLGGDSRYGILYRCPQDVMDLKWLCDENRFKEMIIPVGYQPFMRCKTQSAYMMLTTQFDFDLMQCRDFEKIRFELNPELCEWIFEKMHQGSDIYPAEDIPDIYRYINSISTTNRFSQAVVDGFVESLDEKGKAKFNNWMKQNGLSTVSKLEIISPNKKRKIDKQYPAERAEELTGIEPCANPIIEMF